MQDTELAQAVRDEREAEERVKEYKIRRGTWKGCLLPEEDKVKIAAYVVARWIKEGVA